MSKNLVIVESPAKAHTIEKYLGRDFHVLASVGHIRKDTHVDKDTFDVTYEIDPGHNKIINDLKKAAKAADTVWLATDEDREGEAISWHLMEVLKLPKNTNRITFHEITKPALEAAIQHPRKVDMDMVHSQQARQTLDMLVGYDLSGVVRRKVPGAISAGVSSLLPFASSSKGNRRLRNLLPVPNSKSPANSRPRLKTRFPPRSIILLTLSALRIIISKRSPLPLGKFPISSLVLARASLRHHSPPPVCKSKPTRALACPPKPR